MPTATRRKITNVSGDDLVVPWLAGRIVSAGEIVLVDEEDVPAYLCQPGIWEAGDAETEQAYAEVVAQAEQAAQEAAAAQPQPFDPGPVPLGLEYVVPLTEQSAQYLEHAETPAADAPAPAPEPAYEPTPTRTADAPTPAPAEQPTPAAQSAQSPYSSSYGYRDLANTPADETVTGMLSAVNTRPTL